mmetsp:Transcript_1747/g.5161  ORF Transcript_1747/g.5161 Transcript_1747/m.5161 type:complete len:205 (-) Transcript_1747:285-899(-)
MGEARQTPLEQVHALHAHRGRRVLQGDPSSRVAPGGSCRGGADLHAILDRCRIWAEHLEHRLVVAVHPHLLGRAAAAARSGRFRTRPRCLDGVPRPLHPVGRELAQRDRGPAHPRTHAPPRLRGLPPRCHRLPGLGWSRRRAAQEQGGVAGHGRGARRRGRRRGERWSGRLRLAGVGPREAEEEEAEGGHRQAGPRGARRGGRG